MRVLTTYLPTIVDIATEWNLKEELEQAVAMYKA